MYIYKHLASAFNSTMGASRAFYAREFFQGEERGSSVHLYCRRELMSKSILVRKKSHCYRRRRRYKFSFCRVRSYRRLWTRDRCEFGLDNREMGLVDPRLLSKKRNAERKSR